MTATDTPAVAPPVVLVVDAGAAAVERVASDHRHRGLVLEQDVDLVALHDSLAELEKLNARHARVVELRLLGAMTLAETAQILGISQTTAHSDWNMARAWLRSELASG